MKKLMIIPLFLLMAALAGRAHAADGSAVYILGGIDGKMLTNNDANNYFNLNGVLGPKGYPSGVLHIGFQFSPWMALEAVGDLGPERTNEIDYQNGGFTTRHISTRWSESTLSVMPAFTWCGPGYVNALGLKVGQAMLAGHVNDSAFGADGSYDQEARTLALGLLLRSSHIIAGHLSLGMEVGYDWAMFKDITNKNGTGDYNPVHSPERNVSTFGHNGDQTTLDFSGAHIALIVGLWSAAPVTDVAAQ